MVDRVPTHAASAAVSGGDIANDGDAIGVEANPEEARELAAAVSVRLRGDQKPIAERCERAISDNPPGLQGAVLSSVPPARITFSRISRTGAGGENERSRTR